MPNKFKKGQPAVLNLELMDDESRHLFKRGHGGTIINARRKQVYDLKVRIPNSLDFVTISNVDEMYLLTPFEAN